MYVSYSKVFQCIYFFLRKSNTDLVYYLVNLQANIYLVCISDNRDHQNIT